MVWNMLPSRAGRIRRAPDLRPEQVRLALVLPAVFEEVRAQPHLGSLRDRAAGATANDGSEYLSGQRAKLKLLSLEACTCRV
jgi:hypothetical protein